MVNYGSFTPARSPLSATSAARSSLAAITWLSTPAPTAAVPLSWISSRTARSALMMAALAWHHHRAQRPTAPTARFSSRSPRRFLAAPATHPQTTAASRARRSASARTKSACLGTHSIQTLSELHISLLVHARYDFLRHSFFTHQHRLAFHEWLAGSNLGSNGRVPSRGKPHSR
jgi:hypothetical protein